MPLPVDKEAEFSDWYAEQARRNRLNPDPDDPRHGYDYRGAFLSGDAPSWQSEHQQFRWDDRYKRGGYEDVPDQPSSSRQLPDTFQQGEQRRAETPLHEPLLQASEAHRVPSSLLGKILTAEGAGLGIKSHRGALGPMQVMPELVESFGEDPEEALTNPYLNISIGAKYLSELMSRFGGDEMKALAAYNAGPTRLSKILRARGSNWPQHIPGETKKYLKRAGVRE